MNMVVVYAIRSRVSNAIKRKKAAIKLAYDLITNHIDTPDLLDLIEFHVPCRMLCNTHLLEDQLHRTNYRLFNNISVVVLFLSVT